VDVNKLRCGILIATIRSMQDCFRAHPEHYPDELDDDDEEGEYTSSPEGASIPEGASPESSLPTPLTTSEGEGEKVPITTPASSLPEPAPYQASVKDEKQDPTFSAK
jgi:hypothetical protein